MDANEEKTLSAIFFAINSILKVKGSSYKWSIADIIDGKTNGYSDYKKGVIYLDASVWNNYASATEQYMQYVNYAILAGTVGHEVMHFYQYHNLTPQRLAGFIFEGNLPNDPNKWTDEQLNNYFNLEIEIEAFAFEMLIEEAFLFGDRISPLPIQMNKDKYLFIHDNLKKQFFEAINHHFSYKIIK